MSHVENKEESTPYSLQELKWQYAHRIIFALKLTQNSRMIEQLLK